jgi:hypothetical protein
MSTTLFDVFLLKSSLADEVLGVLGLTTGEALSTLL